jgi:hypothetical protein
MLDLLEADRLAAREVAREPAAEEPAGGVARATGSRLRR